MVGFFKFMVISACLFLAILILVTGARTYKDSTNEKVAWLIFDAYAIGLIYTVVKILEG